MKSFEQIYQLAIKRKGSKTQLLSLLPSIQSKQQVCWQSDDGMLSMMTQCIFQAGFSWKVVNNKWPEFEIVFKTLTQKYLNFYHLKTWKP